MQKLLYNVFLLSFNEWAMVLYVNSVFYICEQIKPLLSIDIIWWQIVFFGLPFDFIVYVILVLNIFDILSETYWTQKTSISKSSFHYNIHKTQP